MQEATVTPVNEATDPNADIDPRQALEEFRAAKSEYQSAMDVLTAARERLRRAQTVARDAVKALQAELGVELDLSDETPIATVRTLSIVKKPTGNGSGRTRRDIVLTLLFNRAEPLKVADIAKETSIDYKTIYNTIKNLEEDALIVQDAEKRWALTDRGREQAKTLI